VAQVCAIQPEIEARGARLLFVGSGTPAMAAAFQAERCPGADVGVDPSLAAYRAFSLRRGLGATFSLRSVGSALGAFSKGHRQGAVEGDALQQGGAFVIGPEGEVLFAHVNQRAGDQVRPEALLAALPASANAPGS
jgi:hypothetical protein